MYANFLKRKGFTILESLISISILSVAVTGPLVYVTNSLKAAEVARDQTIAFYLAQDAVEHIKNVRDNNSLTLSRENWLDGLNGCFGVAGCTFDRVTSIPEACLGVCEVIRKNGVGASFNEYGYGTGGSWEDSPFTRTIIIDVISRNTAGYTPDGNAEEAKITVTINWTTRNTPRTVTVVEHIFNLHIAPTYGN
jgi:prepilin-type N-terminal cleavage/methylation domain-containing protein